MKLSRYTKLVKQSGLCTVLHVKGDGIWLATRAAFYKAAGMPDITGSEITAVLDINSKEAQKIYIEEECCAGVHDIFGMDLTASTAQDIETYSIPVSAVKNGVYATALVCKDGELVFYDDKWLLPVMDVFKESDYVNMVVRVTEKGTRYIVVKDGLEVIAAIMPLKVVDEVFLKDLASFEKRCIEQFRREQSRIQSDADGQTAYTVDKETGEITYPQEQEDED